MKKKLVPDLSASLLTEEDLTRLLGVAGKGASPNPMVRLHGFGAEGKHCKDCQHHSTKKYSKVYHKCELMSPERGLATDIRVGWNACAKFEEKPKLLLELIEETLRAMEEERNNAE